MSTNSRRARRRLVLATLAAVAVALSVAGCGSSLLSPSAAPTRTVDPTPHAYEPTISPVVRVDGACIDATLSTIPSFGRTARSLLASVVGAWARQADAAAPNQSIAPSPGLDLDVRQVYTNSYSTQEPEASIQIVGVPGLRPEPATTSTGYLTDDPIWLAARTAVTQAAAEARLEAATGGRTVLGIPLVDQLGNYSEIVGCVTALGETMPSASQRSIVLFSDLEQNEPPQIAPALANTRVLVVQACDGGNVGACTALRIKWRGWLKFEGATSVQFILPYDAASIVPRFLNGAPS